MNDAARAAQAGRAQGVGFQQAVRLSGSMSLHRNAIARPETEKRGKLLNLRL
jgi:hypothetical protein